jgi:hypothetical protein
MKKRESLISLVCFLVGLSILYGSYLLRIGSLHAPRAGAFPFMIGCAIAFLSVLHLVNQMFRFIVREECVYAWPDKGGWKRLSEVFICLIAYTFCLKYLGFLLCTLLLMFFLLKMVAHKGWVYSILTSSITSFSSFIIFEAVLRIGLPKGYTGF